MRLSLSRLLLLARLWDLSDRIDATHWDPWLSGRIDATLIALEALD